MQGVLEPWAEVRYPAWQPDRRGGRARCRRLIIRTRTRCDGRLLAGSRVRLIATATIGFDHIDTAWCAAHGVPSPADDAALMRLIFDSLAAKYAEVLGKLRRLAPFEIECLHVIGGGVVLRAHPKRSTTATPEKIALLDALRDGDGDRAAECALNLENAPVTCEGIVHAAGCSQAAAKRALESLEKSRKAVCLKSEQAGTKEYFATPRYVQKMRSTIENALLAFHNENPTSTGMSKERSARKRPPAFHPTASMPSLLMRKLLSTLLSTAARFAIPQAGAGAQALEKQAAEALLAALREADGSPRNTR